jgi:ribosome-associated heat shock protein Hsp15
LSETSRIAPQANAAQRIDKWLWFARVAKSRSLAAKLVTEGAVRINRIKTTKPADSVKPGDVITVTVRHHVRVLEVRSPGVRRGPAPEAAALYADLTPPPPPKEDAAATGPQRGPGAGRPTKRDRRLIDKLRERE